MKAKMLTLIVTGFLMGFLIQEIPIASETNKNQDLIKRGEYLVNYGGCNDCHTPKVITPKGPEPDPDKLLSGHPSSEGLPEVPSGMIGAEKWGALANNNLTAWVGPWGVSFAANLTPDNTTGLGAWTEELFIQTMRTGRHLGVGRDILPPMPWYSLAALTDGDLKAILAYLHSVKPVGNQVPQPIPLHMQ